MNFNKRLNIGAILKIGLWTFYLSAIIFSANFKHSAVVTLIDALRDVRKIWLLVNFSLGSGLVLHAIRGLASWLPKNSRVSLDHASFLLIDVNESLFGWTEWDVFALGGLVSPLESHPEVLKALKITLDTSRVIRGFNKQFSITNLKLLSRIYMLGCWSDTEIKAYQTLVSIFFSSLKIEWIFQSALFLLAKRTLILKFESAFLLRGEIAF